MNYLDNNNFPVEFPNRFANTQVIGRKQTGKTTLIAEMILDDIYNGAGVALFDAYGAAAKLVLDRIPEERWDDVVLIEPHTQRNHPVAYNPFFNIKPEDRSKFVAGEKYTLKSVWDYISFPTPTMDDTITNSVAAVLETNEPTLVSLKWFLTSKKHRDRALLSVKDKIIKNYWTNDFDSLSKKQQSDDTRSTLTKIRAFTSDPLTRHILGQPVSKIDLKEIMDTGKILIVNLPIGQIGLEATKLLGSLLMADLHNVALARSGDPFYCFVDGCNRFAYSTQVEMLDTPASSQVGYVFTHSFLDQLEPQLKNALIGSAGNIVSFATGVLDEGQLGALFPENQIFSNLFELEQFDMCLRLHGREKVVRETLPELNYPIIRHAAQNIRNLTQNKYTNQRKDVERALARFIKDT